MAERDQYLAVCRRRAPRQRNRRSEFGGSSVEEGLVDHDSLSDDSGATFSEDDSSEAEMNFSDASSSNELDSSSRVRGEDSSSSSENNDVDLESLGDESSNANITYGTSEVMIT